MANTLVKHEIVTNEINLKMELQEEQINNVEVGKKKIDSKLWNDIPIKTEAVYLMEEPMSAQSSEAPVVKREEKEWMLQLNAPTLTQMDISQILNKSDYEDYSSDEDPCKLREHETESEDSSTDNEAEDKSQSLTEGGTIIGNVTNGDIPDCGDRPTVPHPPNNWHRTRFIKPKPCLQYPTSANSCKDVSDYFHEYLDDVIFDQIVQSTNQTVLQKQGKTLNFTRAECKTFFGIVITMSCINYPNIRMYWNRKWAIHIIAKAMTRDRFLLLQHSLKLVFDDDVNEEMRAADQLWKVRPIINRVLQGCHKQTRHQNLAIYEMVIPLKGAHPIKQYCPDKPNPTGVKILVLANPNGLICDFVTYQGENNPVDEMILHLTRTLTPGHVLYFNQNFTTIELAKELNENGFKCVGAITKSRLPDEAKCQLLSDKSLARQGRGSHDVVVSPDSQMAVTKWFDNKPQLFLSTVYAAETVGHCRRYDRKRGKNVRVPRPEVVKEYDHNMAAVGLSEATLAECHSQTSTNKWMLLFTLHFTDLAICNSYIQYKKDMQTQHLSVHKIYKLWEFKRLIGEQLIELNLSPDVDTTGDDSCIVKRGRPPLAPIPSKVMRVRGSDHLPMVGAVHRCRNSGCLKKTTVSCTTCKLNLCLTRNRNCFMQFHTDGHPT